MVVKSYTLIEPLVKIDVRFQKWSGTAEFHKAYVYAKHFTSFIGNPQ